MFNIFEKLINTEDKIKMVGIDTLKFDEEFKGVFVQESEKVDRIAENMKTNGFDKSQPIIITEDNLIIDGNSRFMAAQKAGIKNVPVIVKNFENKEAALIYEYNLQLNRRNLSDSEIFMAFQKLDELKTESGDKAKTNEAIAEQLSISQRQVSKLREVGKKASTEILDKLKSGDITLNKAYNEMKEVAKKIEKKTPVEAKNKEQKKVQEHKPKKIDSESFALGILFSLEQISKGKKSNEVIKDKRLLKLGITGRKLTEEEQLRIEKKFSTPR